MRLTNHGARTHGALVTFIAPRLARDAKLPDIAGILAGSSKVNRISQRASIANAVRAVTQSRLAQDASIDDIAELLEAMERVTAEAEGGEDDDPDESLPMTEGDDDVLAKVLEFCRARMRPEDAAELEEMLGASDRRRARDGELPRPAGPARRDMGNLTHHEPAFGGDRGRARDAHDALPAGIKPAAERFASIRVRPAEFAFPDVTSRHHIAHDSALPVGVTSGETRYPSIAKRIRLGWSA